jgi:hypothetical protein
MRFCIWCQATGPFPSMWHGQRVVGWSSGEDGVTQGEMWTADTWEEADARCIELASKSGAYIYEIKALM